MTRTLLGAARCGLHGLCVLSLAGCAVPAFLQQRPAGPPVVYDCEDGLRLTVRYADEAAQVTLPDGQRLQLAQQPAGSGVRYAGGPNELRGKGRDITWAVDGRIPTNCIAQGR